MSRKTGRRWSHTLASTYGMVFMATIMEMGEEPRVWWRIAAWACACFALGIAEVLTINKEDRE